jgi:hypothetical protein
VSHLSVLVPSNLYNQDANFEYLLKYLYFAVYRITVRRQRFIHYMTVCVDEYNSSGRCLTQLQKQKMLGVAHTYKIFSSVHHVAQHTTPHYGFRIVGRKFNYRGHGGYWNSSKSLLLIFIKCVILRFPTYIYNSYIYINIHRYYILSALKWETLTFKR